MLGIRSSIPLYILNRIRFYSSSCNVHIFSQTGCSFPHNFVVFVVFVVYSIDWPQVCTEQSNYSAKLPVLVYSVFGEINFLVLVVWRACQVQ